MGGGVMAQLGAVQPLQVSQQAVGPEQQVAGPSQQAAGATPGVVDLVPGVTDLKLYAGDGVSLALQVTDAQGANFNVTGTVTAQVRYRRQDTDVVSAFACDSSGAATGRLVLSLTGAQTGAMIVNPEDTEMMGEWDVQWKPAGGEPRTLVQGDVHVVLDVTRP